MGLVTVLANPRATSYVGWEIGRPCSGAFWMLKMLNLVPGHAMVHALSMGLGHILPGTANFPSLVWLGKRRVSRTGHDRVSL